MIALDHPSANKNFNNKGQIQEALIYEILDGTPIYRKGYKEVLNHKKTLEHIMGCSMYQWKIIEYLLGLLFSMPQKKIYNIATNEPGIHIDHRNNLAGDILVFKKEDVPGVSQKYTHIPAVLHIEVDITADIDQGLDLEYLQNKINKLLKFGTQKIIWVFTSTNKILVVSSNEWRWHSIHETLHLLDEVHFCIGEFLESEGVVFEEGKSI